MKIAIAELRSVSAYSQSGPHLTPKLDKESADDFEKRTWKEKGHWTEAGNMYIPPMSFAKSIQEAAHFLSIKIKGKGQATWTKHFLAGVTVMNGLELPVTKEAVLPEWVYCNADGKKGPGTRVWRCFPTVPKWSGEVTFHILDNEITEAAFLMHLKEAGMLIGLGRWRPRNGGMYGRYEVVSLKWKDMGSLAA